MEMPFFGGDRCWSRRGFVVQFERGAFTLVVVCVG
jgi:hypothetical protein